jgi:hypothetical protein
MNFKIKRSKEDKNAKKKHNCNTPLVTQAKNPTDINTKSPNKKKQMMRISTHPSSERLQSNYTFSFRHTVPAPFVDPSFLFMAPQNINYSESLEPQNYC